MLVVIVAPSYINIKIHAFLFIRKFTRERGVCVLFFRVRRRRRSKTIIIIIEGNKLFDWL